MQGFPLRVRMLSRLSSAKEIRETKQGLKDGAVEIVIGTHALLAKDIEFCNLGLLIIAVINCIFWYFSDYFY